MSRKPAQSPASTKTHAIPKERTLILPRSGQSVSVTCEIKNVINYNLRVREDGTIHLSAPRRTTVAEMEAFLVEHEDWLLGAMQRMEARRAARPALRGETTDTLPYLGTTLTVLWQAGTPAGVEAELARGILRVTLPDPADPAWRQAAIETFEKNETDRLVRELVALYHPLFAARGVPYPAHIRVKTMKTRWGSCASHNGSLNFAARLCEYPRAFAEYVVVHELCHFLHPDHSTAFWREVERVLPDYRVRERIGKNGQA